MVADLIHDETNILAIESQIPLGKELDALMGITDSKPVFEILDAGSALR
jgi:hypothetical protein